MLFRSSIVEIGPFLGRSTSAILHGKKETVNLDVVDTFTGIPLNAKYTDLNGNIEAFDSLKKIAIETGDWEQSFRQCQGADIEKMNVFKCSSKNFELKKPYDFSFIDGGHSFEEIYADLEKFSNPNGIIAGDDFYPTWPDVTRAVNMSRLKKYNTLVVPRRSKIWIIVPNNEYWIQCVKEII